MVLSVPMNPSAAVVTWVSATITLIFALRARSMTLLSAEDEFGASTIPSTPREMEFSTSCTCSFTSVSDVGPKSETVSP